MKFQSSDDTWQIRISFDESNRKALSTALKEALKEALTDCDSRSLMLPRSACQRRHPFRTTKESHEMPVWKRSPLAPLVVGPSGDGFGKKHSKRSPIGVGRTFHKGGWQWEMMAIRSWVMHLDTLTATSSKKMWRFVGMCSLNFPDACSLLDICFTTPNEEKKGCVIFPQKKRAEIFSPALCVTCGRHDFRMGILRSSHWTVWDSMSNPSLKTNSKSSWK